MAEIALGREEGAYRHSVARAVGTDGALVPQDLCPFGISVSSLYGASGLSAGDEDALRSREIVIATPEKLDFALRSDPSLINDVGLIVLDEGHMIGPSERGLVRDACSAPSPAR